MLTEPNIIIDMYRTRIQLPMQGVSYTDGTFEHLLACIVSPAELLSRMKGEARCRDKLITPESISITNDDQTDMRLQNSTVFIPNLGSLYRG